MSSAIAQGGCADLAALADADVVPDHLERTTIVPFRRGLVNDGGLMHIGPSSARVGLANSRIAITISASAHDLPHHAGPRLWRAPRGRAVRAE